MPTRVGLVGLGKIAQDQHVPVIAADPDFELAAVVSSRGASEPGVPTFRTLAELIASGHPVDAVSICTPPGVRHAIAREALEAGLPVLLEKPPAMTLTECADLEEAATAAGVPLFATWHSQYNAAVRTARERLAGRRLRRLHIHWHESVRKWHPGQEWIWQAGGFGVFDPGINALSIVTRITPEPLSIAEAEMLVPANRDTPIAATLRLRSLRGGEADITGAFDWRDTDRDEWTIAVETTDGDHLLISNGGAHVRLADGSEVAEPKREYEGIYRRWAALLAAGESDVEVAPLRLVADAFLNGRIRQTDAFEW